MTQKELVNGIFERLVKEAEVDHEPSATFIWLEEERQMWLKKITETVKQLTQLKQFLSVISVREQS